MKIFAFPSHGTPERTSGVDFARIIQPMKHLGGVTIYDPAQDKKQNWIEVAMNYDIIYLNYTLDAWHFAQMGCMARKYGKIIVMDLDDALWEVQNDNPAYEAMKKGSPKIKDFTSMCNEADYLTCTNMYLKHLIHKYTKKPQEKIKVLDNYIDLDLYRYRPQFKDDGQIRITWFGSTTHFIDLQTKEFVDGIHKVMQTYPQVTFKTIGAFVPEFAKKWGPRYEHDYGDQDIYKWIKNRYPIFMEEADIVVAPLALNIYTKCKSAIKYLEYSAAKKPGVFQRIRQYEEVIIPGENGYLAGTADEWFESISKLIKDPKHRKEVGENAFKDVRDHYTIQGNIWRYKEWFSTIA
jgi:glycosyltransferase involved in cell wall biosynthesis